MQQITVGGKNFNLVTIPGYPGFSDISMTVVDAVAVVQSPYVPSQSQTQQWPGADAWQAQITLPPMDRETAAPWRAFFAECQGMANVFQIGDQGAGQGVERWAGNRRHRTLQGSNPVVDGATGNNPISSNVLYTKGWKASQYRIILPGDYLQIGYRLYMVEGQLPVNSDANGKAQIQVYPSLRETPLDSTAIILTNPVGLFRLAENKRDWHTAVTRFTNVSFKCVEVR